MILLLMIIGYFAVGLTLVFVGPASRLSRRERERLKWRACGDTGWRVLAFSFGLALSIIFLWPFLVVSAARNEAASEADLLSPSPAEPSTELNHWVSYIQDRYSNRLPFVAYREISDKLSWSDCAHLDDRLEQLGYMIIDFAKSGDGQDVPVAARVLQVGSPIALTRLRGSISNLPEPRRLGQNQISSDPLQHGLSFQIPSKPEDEVWGFSSSWGPLSGISGLALVRDKNIIDAYVTVRS